MEQSDVKLDEFLAQVEYGEVRIKVVDKRLFAIPPQVIRRPEKTGVCVEIVIHKSILLRMD